VFDQRGGGSTSSLIAHGPHVIAGSAGNAGQVAASDGRGGDNAPARSVEVLRKRYLSRGVLANVTDRPNVVVSDRGGPAEVRIVDKRARNDMQALLPKGAAGAARNHSDCEQPQQQARSRRFHIAAINFSHSCFFFR